MNTVNKYIVAGFILSGSVLFWSFTYDNNIQDQPSDCNTTEIRKQARELFNSEFHYDASKSVFITFMNKKQFKELEVPLYIGEKYMVVFNTSSLPQKIDIEVYDKEYTAKERELLFSSKDAKEKSPGVYVFEPTKRMRRMFIDYSIPATDGAVEKGCVVVTLGYKIK